MNLDFLVSLWPSKKDFPHFGKFANDSRLGGIRLNSAMMKYSELNSEFEEAKKNESVPLYFDVKGRQLRVTDVKNYDDHLELEINHPIEVETPQVVLFKAGADYALLDRVENETKLIFDGGPQFFVYQGESLHIKHPSLKVKGSLFLDAEVEKVKKAMDVGFRRYFLSYVQEPEDIDKFRELVGDSQIIAKIEDKRGLEYVANKFKKQDNLSLMAARGDLYVELDRPHQMMDALKLIINKDPEASVGSRLLLSLVNKPVPECSDLMDLAWLYDIGYRKMMLCDELCLKEEWLSSAVDVLDNFRKSYAK